MTLQLLLAYAHVSRDMVKIVFEHIYTPTTYIHTYPTLAQGITWGTSKGIWDVLPSGREIIFEIPHPAFSPCSVSARTQKGNSDTHI